MRYNVYAVPMRNGVAARDMEVVSLFDADSRSGQLSAISYAVSLAMDNGRKAGWSFDDPANGVFTYFKRAAS